MGSAHTTELTFFYVCICTCAFWNIFYIKRLIESLLHLFFIQCVWETRKYNWHVQEEYIWWKVSACWRRWYTQPEITFTLSGASLMQEVTSGHTIVLNLFKVQKPKEAVTKVNIGCRVNVGYLQGKYLCNNPVVSLWLVALLLSRTITDFPRKTKIVCCNCLF